MHLVKLRTRHSRRQRSHLFFQAIRQSQDKDAQQLHDWKDILDSSSSVLRALIHVNKGKSHYHTLRRDPLYCAYSPPKLAGERLKFVGPQQLGKCGEEAPRQLDELITSGHPSPAGLVHLPAAWSFPIFSQHSPLTRS